MARTISPASRNNRRFAARSRDVQYRCNSGCFVLVSTSNLSWVVDSEEGMIPARRRARATTAIALPRRAAMRRAQARSASAWRTGCRLDRRRERQGHRGHQATLDAEIARQEQTARQLQKEAGDSPLAAPCSPTLLAGPPPRREPGARLLRHAEARPPRPWAPAGGRRRRRSKPRPTRLVYFGLERASQ